LGDVGRRYQGVCQQGAGQCPSQCPGLFDRSGKAVAEALFQHPQQCAADTVIVTVADAVADVPNAQVLGHGQDEVELVQRGDHGADGDHQPLALLGHVAAEPFSQRRVGSTPL
jgi:hypothetical protein